jgi:hypothetical protein
VDFRGPKLSIRAVIGPSRDALATEATRRRPLDSAGKSNGDEPIDRSAHFAFDWLTSTYRSIYAVGHGDPAELAP